MQLIKLDATPSTNNYLKQLVTEKNLEDFTAVVCSHQTRGRGQKGNSWVSDKGKNLTVSILKKFKDFEASRSFLLNCLISLTIYEVLNELSIPSVKVKWPNDIMSGNKKLCGILIENSLKGYHIKQSIIGFGLNVNQTNFENLPHATSLKLKTERDYELDSLLNKILQRLKDYFTSLEEETYSSIKSKYVEVLFRKGERTCFIGKNDERFFGIILGVTDDGRLKIKTDSGNQYLDRKSVV